MSWVNDPTVVVVISIAAIVLNLIAFAVMSLRRRR